MTLQRKPMAFDVDEVEVTTAEPDLFDTEPGLAHDVEIPWRLPPSPKEIRSTLTPGVALSFRPPASANGILGSLAIGTPGNFSYTSPTALYVDFNNGTLANVLNTTTNLTVYSNATIRISGQNGSAYNLVFPKKFTLSGDG